MQKHVPALGRGQQLQLPGGGKHEVAASFHGQLTAQEVPGDVRRIWDEILDGVSRRLCGRILTAAVVGPVAQIFLLRDHLTGRRVGSDLGQAVPRDCTGRYIRSPRVN